jgi:hypothetical protein
MTLAAATHELSTPIRNRGKMTVAAATHGPYAPTESGLGCPDHNFLGPTGLAATRDASPEAGSRGSWPASLEDDRRNPALSPPQPGCSGTG